MARRDTQSTVEQVTVNLEASNLNDTMAAYKDREMFGMEKKSSFMFDMQ